MSLEGQRLQPDRYALIPRTLIFLTHGNEILLIKVANDRGAWAGFYNGIGGHVEKGEDPLSAAFREIKEETNLSPQKLTLCGIIQIDTKINPGIGLFVFLGSVKDKGEMVASPEGQPEWIPIATLAETPLVEDIPRLIPRVLAMREGNPPFFAQYHYDSNDQLTISFASER